MKYNIFIIALDNFHLSLLRNIKDGRDYNFYNLLPYDMMINPPKYNIDEIISRGEKELDNFNGKIHGIIGHWDFPTTSLLPVFREYCGLDGPSLESVLITENKYWTRIRSKRCIPGCTPNFQAVNPFDDNCAKKITLPYPFWLKPVVAFSSQMAFYVQNQQQLAKSLEIIRNGIGRFGKPFEKFIKIADMPEDIPVEIDGYHCIAEEPIVGKQCTAEGYVKDSKPEVYAIVDSYREGKFHSSFSRYQLPSNLPEPIKKRVRAKCIKITNEMGLNNTTFNIEVFWDEAKDKLCLLEVNSRLSKSHSPIFEDVAGMTQHKVAIDIELGYEPDFSIKRGKYNVAAKFMFRRYKDGIITRIPAKNEIKELENKYPGTRILIEVEEGDTLSELLGQDSYSYELAVIFMGASDTNELLKNYELLKQELHFEFKQFGRNNEIQKQIS